MNKDAKILIGCEESGIVTEAFRERGYFNTFSCDIMETSGLHPDWHIKDDVLKHLKGWDIIVAFPPCTHLAVSGARWFDQKRKDGRQHAAIQFFMALVNAPCNCNRESRWYYVEYLQETRSNHTPLAIWPW